MPAKHIAPCFLSIIHGGMRLSRVQWLGCAVRRQISSIIGFVAVILGMPQVAYLDRDRWHRMNQHHFYVTGLALSQFVLGAESLGIDTRPLLSHAGLGEEHLAPGARVPELQYEMLLLQMSSASRNDSIGGDVGQQVMLSLYGALTPILLNSKSVAEGLRNIAAYQALATGNCGGVECAETDEGLEVCVVMTHGNAVVRRIVVECVLTLFCGLLRLISCKQGLSPKCVWIEHPPSSERSRRYVESLLACPVRWGNGPSRMIIDEATCRMKIHGEVQEILQMAKMVADRQLESLKYHCALEESIQWHARELMLTGIPRREVVASRMKISVSTLDRRLKQAGLSWQSLMDGLRAQLAMDYLSDPRLTVVEVSEKLGFSEIRAFQRRFKVWTGMTPSAFRKIDRV
jgi:AraC-like DNA-binding protein